MTVPCRLLVIDDNPDDRMLAVRALRGAFPGTDCVEIADAAGLARALDAGGFDAVVTDYQLMWTTGLDVLHAIRVRFPEVPVVMFTNTGSEEVCAAALREGVHDYILKKAGQYVMLAPAIRSGLAMGAARRAVREHEAALREALEAEQAARRRAERADQLKDEFLSTLSHELRTPLNAIMGWSQVLLRAAGDAETVRKGAQVIERNVRAQSRIIEDLLDVSKIVSGNLRLEMQPVELVPAVEAAIESVLLAARAKGVTLERSLDPSAGVVTGDATRLQQVTWNLLTNAIKFTPAGGTVRLSLAAAPPCVEITVSDTGEGIDAAFLPHVFDRLRQADGSSTRRHGGLGLGLSIVKHIVELHGGTVRAASGGPGRGSTFVVSLPAAPAGAVRSRASDQGPQQPAEQEPRVRLGGLRILVVDDEADARELMQRVLAHTGAEVRLAGTAAEALGAIARERPDVLVSDIGMPGEDGYALISRLRKAEGDAPRIPAIALTAFARAEDRRKALLAGFHLHITKPVDAAELTVAIASLAGRTGG